MEIINKIKDQKFFWSLALLVIFFVFIFFISQKHNLLDIKEIKIAGQNIKVEVVSTPGDQARGLSGRSELKEDEGMLFIFESLGKYPFWMKDMNFPIDIIWLAPSKGGDREAKVVYIKKDARPASSELQRGEPESYLETYAPDRDAKYVLEVTSGFSDKNNLQVGDRVEFVY